MNLIRVGKIVVNFDLVTDVLPGDPAGSHPESLIVCFGGERKHTFTGQDADDLREFLVRTSKESRSPRKDHGFD